MDFANEMARIFKFKYKRCCLVLPGSIARARLQNFVICKIICYRITSVAKRNLSGRRLWVLDKTSKPE